VGSGVSFAGLDKAKKRAEPNGSPWLTHGADLERRGLAVVYD